MSMGEGVINILTGSVRRIRWCIVERQVIWREGMLILNLHTMGAAHTCQLFASHIQGWMTYLIKAR